MVAAADSVMLDVAMELFDATTYWPRIEIGDTMRAFAVGEIIESRNPRYSTGEKVMGLFGWQEYAAATDKHVNLKIAPRDLPALIVSRRAGG